MRRFNVTLSLNVSVSEDEVKEYGVDHAVERAVSWRLCGNEDADLFACIDKTTEHKTTKEPT